MDASELTVDLAVRQATEGDCRRFKEIIDLSFPRFYRFFATRGVNSEEGKVLVAETRDAIAGFAKLIEFNVGNIKYGCILWVAVDPTQRRKGYAAVLVNAGYEYLTRIGTREVFASVHRRNKASLATFREDGFVQVGFFALRRHFGWRLLSFYSSIWYAPGEIVLVKHPQK